MFLRTSNFQRWRDGAEERSVHRPAKSVNSVDLQVCYRFKKIVLACFCIFTYGITHVGSTASRSILHKFVDSFRSPRRKLLGKKKGFLGLFATLSSLLSVKKKRLAASFVGTLARGQFTRNTIKRHLQLLSKSWYFSEPFSWWWNSVTQLVLFSLPPFKNYFFETRYSLFWSGYQMYCVRWFPYFGMYRCWVLCALSNENFCAGIPRIPCSQSPAGSPLLLGSGRPRHRISS